MKLKALKDLTIYGTAYRKGATLDVSQEAAEKLIRSGQARITIDELAAHLAGQRCTTPANMAGGMRIIRL